MILDLMTKGTGKVTGIGNAGSNLMAVCTVTGSICSCVTVGTYLQCSIRSGTLMTVGTGVVVDIRYYIGAAMAVCTVTIPTEVIRCMRVAMFC